MIDFYYWGLQCPHNYSNIQVLKTIQDNYHIEVNYYDLASHHELAESLHIYSPTMTIFDNDLRWTGPITYKLVENYISGILPKRTPYLVESENIYTEGTYQVFTPHQHKSIENLCCFHNYPNSSEEKAKWLKEIMDKYELKHLGILHYLESKCVGGAEFIPSLEVPYGIPKSSEIAFITCVYSSDQKYDYKKYPLMILEKELVNMGYDGVYLIASERVAFPNGPMTWFTDQGYSDCGLLFYEKNDDANQHLMYKKLKL